MATGAGEVHFVLNNYDSYGHGHLTPEPIWMVAMVPIQHSLPFEQVVRFCTSEGAEGKKQMCVVS